MWGCVVWNAVGPALRGVRVRGAWVTQDTKLAALSGGTAASFTAIDLSTFVPANALEVRLSHDAQITSNASGSVVGTLKFGNVTGVVSHQWNISYGNGGTGNSVPNLYGEWQFTLPLTSQQIFYDWDVTAGTSQQTNVYAQAYKVPNGDS